MSEQGKTKDVKMKGLYVFKEHFFKRATKFSSKCFEEFEVKISFYIWTLFSNNNSNKQNSCA